MKVVRFYIQRQPDNTFAIIARVKYNNGTMREIVLHQKPSAKDLQQAFTTYIHDRESLEADIMAKLQQHAV